LGGGARRGRDDDLTKKEGLQEKRVADPGVGVEGNKRPPPLPLMHQSILQPALTAIPISPPPYGVYDISPETFRERGVWGLTFRHSPTSLITIRRLGDTRGGVGAEGGLREGEGGEGRVHLTDRPAPGVPGKL